MLSGGECLLPCGRFPTVTAERDPFRPHASNQAMPFSPMQESIPRALRARGRESNLWVDDLNAHWLQRAQRASAPDPEGAGLEAIRFRHAVVGFDWVGHPAAVSLRCGSAVPYRLSWRAWHLPTALFVLGTITQPLRGWTKLWRAYGTGVYRFGVPRLGV